MAAYAELQQDEFRMESEGFTAHKHQREVGTGYFDKLLTSITSGPTSVTALDGSTEEEQFEPSIA